MLEADVHSAALLHLRALFPLADPLYLDALVHQYQRAHFHSSDSHASSSSAQHASSASNRKGKGKVLSRSPGAGSGEVVNALSAKLLDMKGEYPRAAWRPVGRMATARRVSRGASSSWKEMRASGAHKVETGADLGLPEMDITLTRNQALVRLHAIFPSTSIDTLRQLLSDAPHSYLQRAADALLSRARDRTRSPGPSLAGLATFLGLATASSPRPSSTKSAAAPVLCPQDLFRSPEYEGALVEHLRREYPLVPLSVIQGIVRQGGPLPIVIDQVRTWRGKQSAVRNFFSDLFVSPSPSSAERPLLDEELDEELSAELFALQAAEREDATRDDERIARELNEEWTSEGDRFECGCCYDDVPFEDVATCSAGEHLFCRSCVGRAVTEHVYGGAPLSLSGSPGPGEGSGVRCLSTEGCPSPFAMEELERALRPKLFRALERRLADAALEALAVHSARNPSKDGPLKLIKCPFCPYTEQAERSACLSRAFPLFTRSQPEAMDALADVIRSIVSLGALIILHLLASTVVFVFPETFQRFHLEEVSRAMGQDSPPERFFPLLEPYKILPLAHAFVDETAQRVLSRREGYGTVFRCRNTPSGEPLPEFGEGVEGTKSRRELLARVWPLRQLSADEEEEYCGRLSCIQCLKPYAPGHKCWENEKDGLRLAVERAMSEAVKRSCPACGLTFTKDQGCNKMTCRCGRAMCFICKEDITTIKYQHFCQHFLPNVGVPCTECKKCSLWVHQSDEAAAARAASKARESWMREHPGVEHSSSIATQAIGPGGFGLHDLAGSVFRGLTELSKVVLEVILV